jgi:hypothetical protein
MSSIGSWEAMMVQKLMTAPAKTGAQSECSHHWVIESPDGPTSQGRCKHCGVVKEFSNYLPYSSWNEEKAPARKRSRRNGAEEGEPIAT